MPLLSQHGILGPAAGRLSRRSLASAVEERFKWAREAKKPVELQWYINMAYHLGTPVDLGSYDEDLEVDITTAVSPLLPTEKELQVSHNLIMPAVMKTTSRLTAHKPWVAVMPSTMDESDVGASRIATKLLEYYRRNVFTAPTTVGHATWNAICGSAIYRIGWDTHAGETLDRRPLAPGSEAILPTAKDSGSPAEFTSPLDRWYQKVSKSRSGDVRLPEVTEELMDNFLAEGDVTVETVPPFEIYPEPGVDEWDKLTWIIHARLRSREDIASIWGTKVAKAAVTCNWASEDSAGFNPERFTGFDSSPYSDQYHLDVSESGGKGDTVLILDYWERASAKHPRGRHVQVIGGSLVKDEDNPFPFNTFPYTFTVFQKLPGSLWGRGVVDNLIPALNEYNQTLSELALARDFTCHPPMLVPRQGQMSPSVQGNFPGRTWEYNAPYEPHYAVPPAMPTYLGAALEHSVRAFQDLAFTHEASQGMAPSNARAGIQLQLMQEADDSTLRTTYDLQDEAVRRACQMMLLIAQRFYVTERTVRLVGASRQHEVIHFTGADLRGAADVYIEPRSALPESLAARRELALDLYSSGILGSQEDPVTKMRVLKMMELGHVWDMVSEQLTLEEQVLKQLSAVAAQAGGVGQLVQLLRSTAEPVTGPPGALPQAQGPGGIPAMGPAQTAAG